MGLEQKKIRTIPGILNLLTIDVEDYFQVHAFSRVIRTCDWANYRCRVEHNTYRLLEILNNVCPQRALPSPEACSSNCMASISQTKARSASFRLLADEGHKRPRSLRSLTGSSLTPACNRSNRCSGSG